MKRRIGFSALTLLVACGVGFVLGTVMNERPRVAFAQAAAAPPPPEDAVS